ncbi:MAG: hypothetical protein GF411_02550 [Candidatus Lokiarchaeota archaeon]|nr:hypothetical protein [Candidatus Lokiarchaeota archaeon]
MIHSYSDSKIVENILQLTGLIQEALNSLTRATMNISLVHSLLYNAGSYESAIAQSACGYLSCGYSGYTFPTQFIPNRQEVLMELKSAAKLCDILFYSYSDKSKLGNGRSLCLEAAETIQSPLLSLGDEIFAFQSALGYILPIYRRLGKLKEKKVVVSWGYDTRFSLPATAHALVYLSAVLGADVSIIAPKDFPLLRRVLKKSKKIAGESDGSVETVERTEKEYHDADAVFAFNWCSVNEFIRPERNKDLAFQYRDWQISKDCLDNALFMTEQPQRLDMIAERAVMDSSANLTSHWLESRILVLLASMDAIFRHNSTIRALV